MFGLTSNIDQVIERFRASGEKLQNVDPSEALLVGVNAAKGQMQYRIFNEGTDADGNSLGKYTGKKSALSKNKEERLFKGKKKQFLVGPEDAFSEYELIRIKAGRQIRYKDLELTGDLRRGITVVTDGNVSVICVIKNQQLARIADGQEVQIGKIRGTGPVRIFSLSKDERELMRKNITEALKQIYGRVFNS